MARPTKLGMKVQTGIVEFIRAGTFIHVAAGANGITVRTFDNWMKRGREALLASEEPDVNLPAREYKYLAFFLQVSKAKAQARAAVEIRVQREDPRIWLRNGPGKTTPEMEGWTDPTRRLELTGKDGEPIAVEHVLAGALLELEDEAAREAEFAVVEEAPKLPAPKPTVDVTEGEEGW